MRFGPWLPLLEAQASAPAGPGVLQARGQALIQLPRGKSAMVLYAASTTEETLRSFVLGRGALLLATASGLGACWVRFAETRRPDAELDRLLRLFVERFGAAPPANREKMADAG
jgi:hypothetical protein